METEYLDAVNKELREIERFFQQMYPPCSKHTGDDNSGITPFINFPTYTSSSDAFSGDSSVDSAGAASEEYLRDLKERYKQLKAIQDRLHVELTILRVWKQTGGDKQPPQDCHSCQQRRHHNQQTEPMATKANATNAPTSTKQHTASPYPQPSSDTATQDSAPKWDYCLYKLFFYAAIVYLMIEFLSVYQTKGMDQGQIFMPNIPSSPSPSPPPPPPPPPQYKTYAWPRH